MFILGTPLWNIAIRSLLVYVAVFLGLRLMGKRELGQMTVFDLVVVLPSRTPSRTRWSAPTPRSKAGSWRRSCCWRRTGSSRCSDCIEACGDG